MPATLHTRHPYIAQRATVQGGEPIILGTRVPVRTIVRYVLRQGIAPEVVVKEFPHLTLAQVYDRVGLLPGKH